ncbi:MAG: tRNA uridine-5-carboxymethylaminomethyl(34) synthesis GTPase MnmE [Actinobacteria bacterium]|nr:tRNA uridine-5-carboxymethylaminomethyl(34) synthesis GTPase MnmE [Actinomycetota bacterium]
MNKSASDTIAAIGTKPGEAAIGIIRLSGNKSVKLTEKIFRQKNRKKISQMKTFSMTYGYIVDKKEEMIDEVIITLMKKPKSYTKEDVVEINCHGGMAAADKILELCIKNGARIAEPGEFTKRAFLNGRIDLSQAEAVIDLIRSKTEQSLKVAANNIKGIVKDRIEELRKRILDVLVELEASIDFIEEDLEVTPYEVLEKNVIEIQKSIDELINDEKRGEIIKNGIKVAIVGKPNVGKSSLLNVLARKERAIVTHIPGTTRDAVEEILYIEGIPLIIADTAGIRKSKNIIEKIGVKKSFEYISKSELVILVMDGNTQIDDNDCEIVEELQGKNIIICLNKIDLKQITSKKEINKKFKLNDIIEISAKKNIGIDKLEKKIKTLVLGEEEFNIESKIIVNNRQKNILLDASGMLKHAIKAMKLKMSEEFPSSDLKLAYNLLGEITGQTTTNEILDGIFGKFCVGK